MAERTQPALHVDLVDAATYEAADTPAIWARLRDEAPVYWDATNRLWGVTRYEDVHAVSTRADAFSARFGVRPNYPPDGTMLSMDDPDHAALRAKIRKAFTPRMVALMEDHVRDVVREILDAVEGREQCEFVDDLAIHLPLIVLAELLGFPPADRWRMRAWSDDMLDSADGNYAFTERTQQAFVEFKAYTDGVFADRADTPRDDLMTAILHAEIDGERLSEWDRFAFSYLLLIAGNETTRNAISGAMRAFVEHRDAWERVCADPTILPSAVEETLRWVSPVMSFRRTATTDVELGGSTIRKGDQVLMLYCAANRDPAVFDDPEVFDITRDPNPHLAFGIGPHFCLGAALARLEVRVFFEELSQRHAGIDLVAGGAVERTGSAFVAGIERFPVVLAP